MSREGWVEMSVAGMCFRAFLFHVPADSFDDVTSKRQTRTREHAYKGVLSRRKRRRTNPAESLPYEWQFSQFSERWARRVITVFTPPSNNLFVSNCPSLPLLIPFILCWGPCPVRVRSFPGQPLLPQNFQHFIREFSSGRQNFFLNIPTY